MICLLVCVFFFFFNDTATTEIYTVYNTLSLHDALPMLVGVAFLLRAQLIELRQARPAASVRSEEHTSELQSLYTISYAVFCLKKKKQKKKISQNFLVRTKNIK